jgi:hypothetical protein
MSYEHPSGVADAYDRAHLPERAKTVTVIHRSGEQYYLQGAELNEAQSLADKRFRQIGNLSARDGDIVEGEAIIVDFANSRVTLAAGQIYVRGHVLPIDAATLENVPMNGTVDIGIYLTVTTITDLDDESLKGIAPGTVAEGEAGAAREEWAISWGYRGDGQTGEFFANRLLRDGVVLETSAPPMLSGIRAAIAEVERVNNGNHVAHGMQVTALGKEGADQVFMIGAGLAHIDGYQNRRDADLRYSVLEEWTSEQIDNEVHQYAEVNGECVLNVSQTPIDQINQVLISKRRTETVTRGPVANTTDALAENSVYQIESIVSGGTTYQNGVDFKLTSNQVDWSLSGAEPSGGNSYDATYLYREVVNNYSSNDTSITVSGGVEGEEVQLQYTSKLPRFDLLGLNRRNEPVMLKGVPSRTLPKAPKAPSDILPLAVIQNYFDGTPNVVQDRTHKTAPHELVWRMLHELVELKDTVALNRLDASIHAQDPVAKNGIFRDPFIDDRFRDQGEVASQTLAVGNGFAQLAIDPIVHSVQMPQSVMLDYVEKVHAEQLSKTGCIKINEFQNFAPLPAELSITPTTDYWTEQATQWTGPVTQVFNQPIIRIADQRRANELGFNGRTAFDITNSTQSTRTELVGEFQQNIAHLRQIDIAFTIANFGNGEILQSLKFDGIDVTPSGPLAAGPDGTIAGVFTIPANVPAGRKLIVATGGSGATAEALFIGQGIVEIDLLRRVTTVRNQRLVFTPPPGETEQQRRWREEREERREARRLRMDPVAQSFWTANPRHIAGIDVEFCAIGDRSKDVIVELVRYRDGHPTNEILDQAVIDMETVTLDTWTSVRFQLPMYVGSVDQFGFVFKSDDGQHALAVATLGEFDIARQQHITGQPYVFGGLSVSADGVSYSHLPGTDLKMRIIEAEFVANTKTVEIGTFDLSAATDLVVWATVDRPTEGSSFHLEIERANGDRILLDPHQAHKFDQYVTETVKLFGVLTGSQFVSPTLFPPITLVEGKIREHGVYITPAFEMGEPSNIGVRMKTMLSNGANVRVFVDKADDNWTEIVQQPARALAAQNWHERHWREDGFSTPQGRIKIEVTGGPSARPVLQDLRAFSSSI